MPPTATTTNTINPNRRPERRLTIVVSAIQAVGHVNACIGALAELRARGHRIIFVLTKIYEGKAAKYGYEEHIFQMDMNEKDQHQPETELDKPMLNPGQVLAQIFLDNRIIGPYSVIEKFQNLAKIRPAFFKKYEIYDLELKKVIDLYKPDLFYIDGELLPSVHYSNIPWINNNSCQPLMYRFDTDLQPGGGGK